jgi:pimeloyl-ACP methyl ester carboxylesterase
MSHRALSFYVSGLLTTLALLPGKASPADRVLPRPDGSSINWAIDRQSPAAGAKQGILLIAQGSGCLAASENPNIASAKRLLPEFAVVTVEKYGVEAHAKPGDPFNECSSTFYAHHTVSQRVEDYQRVLAQLESEEWWNGQLVLFGGSEGGGAVALLAPSVNANAIIIFSSAPGHSFEKLFKMTVPPEIAEQAGIEFEKIKTDRTSSKIWGGNSYRWWADILHQDMTAALLSTHSPILLVQGERDSHAPVAVAREIRDEFKNNNHRNLTYWEFAGYDHSMQDAQDVSHLAEVMTRISTWIRQELVNSRESAH